MDDDDFISKTRRKRQASELQDVGKQLVKLPPDDLARIEMPESLREAVVACRGYSKHEAVRRQMQYIGKIMRDIDAGPIAEQIARLHAPSSRQTALFHVAERWRKEILADDAGIERFAREFPGTDPDPLWKLAGKAREERAADRSPKHFRELFHLIDAIVQRAAKGK